MCCKSDLLPIACTLGVLSASQRARQAELVALHHRSFTNQLERDDGYSFSYPIDAELFAQLAELVTIEHLCCPFLDFRLEWPSGIDSSPWLHILGGARVKPFVAEMFGKVR